nr:FtsX-like permease family protein [Actinomycetales bacterium]
MFRIALRDTREHWVRFAMSILAVLLATAFVSATFSFTNMLGESIAKISDSTATGDIYVRGTEAEGEPSSFGPPQREPVPLELQEQIDAVDGVAASAPTLFGTAILVGPDGRAVANGNAPTFAGVLSEDLNDFEVLEGRVPETTGEIALESATYELSGYAVGDTAPVTIGDTHTFDATIVGTVDSEWSLMGATFLFISEETGLAAFAPTGVVQTFAVALEDGAESDSVIRALEAQLGDGVEVVSGEQVREESQSATAEAMGFIETFMLVFAFIAFFVGSFLIANTFAMLVRQRQREFALLRALGASPGQVLGSLMAQAGIIGVFGSLFGIGTGVLLVIGAQQIFESMGTPLEGTPWLPPARAALVMGVAVVFTIVASLLPARQAAGTAPVEAMRPEDPKPEKTTVVRGIISALMAVAGLACVWMAVDRTEALLLGLGAALVLLGMLGLGPLIVPPLLGVLAIPFRALRPIGTLARGNVLRTPRRTSATAAALTIGMTFVSAAAVLAASATASTRSIIDNQMSADFYVGSQRGATPLGLGQQLEQLDTVSGVTPAFIGAVRSLEPEGNLSVSAMSPEGYEEMLNVPVVEGEPLRSADELLISQTASDSSGIGPGTSLTFAVPGGEDVTMEVVGVTNDQFMFSELYAFTEGFERLVPEQTRAVIFFLVNSTGDPDATRADLEEAVADLPILNVLDKDELAEQTVGLISTMMNVLYALLGLSLVIAVLSIINTLAMAVMERTREIGLMRAVGLGGGQLVGMIMIESVLTALFGTIMGMLIGVGLGATLPSILQDLGLTDLVIPWEALLVILAGTVVVGVIAALWPAWRALRQPVLEAVASE